MSIPDLPSTPRVRVDCNLQTLLYYTQKRLITLGIYNTNTVFMGSLPEQNNVPPDISYAVITPGEFQRQNPETNTWIGQITVRVNFRFSMDIAMRGNLNMTQTSGVTTKINQIITALNLWDMTNGAFYFLAEPMRYNKQTKISKEELGKNLQWDTFDLFFDIRYGEDAAFINPEVIGLGQFTNGYNGGFA